MVKWRIKRGDKIAGEVPSSKVRQLAAAGKLRKTDLLCKEGTEKWVPAGNVKGLWQTSSPSQSKPVVAKDQNKPQPAVASPPASASKAVQTAPPEAEVIRKETPPLQKANEPPQQEAVETSPQQAAVVTPPQQTPPQQEAYEAASQQKAVETAPSEPLPQQEAVEAVPQEETIEEIPQQEASTIGQEGLVEESAPPSIQTLAEPDDEYSEEPDEEYSEQSYDDEAPAPRRKWLVPLIAATLGILLLMGLASAFMGGPESDANQRQSVAMREQQSGAGQRSSSAAGRNLSLTQQFFQPNREKNVEYTTKKFENNTTVALYRKTTIERWDTDTALYYHEKDFRNYGQTVPYKVSNGYIQLKGGENWFRFLKLDAKVGDRWTPGDGKDGTLDWVDKGNPSGELELVDFKMVDSVPVAVVEFTAKLGNPVPSYLVPAAFDFGIMQDGIGPIEGKLRFELGQGLGVLRIDAIVPKGTRHRSGGGRDTSDWIFATRRRNIKPPNGDTAEQPATDGL